MTKVKITSVPCYCTVFRIEGMRIFNGMKFGKAEDRNNMTDILILWNMIRIFSVKNKNSSRASNLITETKNLVILSINMSV